MTKSATNHMMDRYISGVTDAALKQALRNHSLVAVRARAKALLDRYPAPKHLRVPSGDQTPEQLQANLISTMLDTLQASSALDQGVDNALRAVREWVGPQAGK